MLHPTLRKTLEETRSLAESMSRLCRVVRERARKDQPREELALVQDAVLEIEQAGTYLSDLDSSLERLYSDLSTLEDEHARLTTLYEISQTLNSTLDLEQLLNLVMDSIIGVMKAERGFLMLLDEQTQQLDVKVARNMSRETIAESSFQVSRGIIDKVVADSNPILTTNAQSDPRFSAHASVISYSLRSILCAPLMAKNRLIGVVYVDNRIRAGLFSRRDLDLLVAFGNQAAIAIEHARLFESIIHNRNEIAKMKAEMDNIFASIASGVITISSSGEITALNGAAAQIFELSEAEAIGRLYKEVLRPLEHTPLPALIQRAIAADGRFIGQEIQANIGSRQGVVLTVSLSPLKNAENRTVGTAMVIEDVTETRKLLSEKNAIKDTFERVVAKAVVDRLLSAPPKLGGEKQIVTILFADIRGYTAFAERVSPEELLSILNSYFALTTQAILKFEGTVDKFLGDGIMAFFNAPLAQPDHALRGAKAALEMVTRLGDYHRKLGIKMPRINFGIGISTGEAIVGNIGTPELMNYTVIGDAVNVARRLQENARLGEILVSGSTFDLIKDMVQAQPFEPMNVKGRISPVPVFQLLDLADHGRT